MTLHIRNPHSVLAALETRPQDVLEIIAPPGTAEKERAGGSGGPGGEPLPGRDAWVKVVQAARERGIPVTKGERGDSSRGAPPSGRRGGGPGGNPGSGPKRGDFPKDQGRLSVAEAVIKEREGVTAEELFRGATDRAGGKGLWIALDSLTDPHNVGAIFRTASFFGVQGILLTQERSAPLTSAVYDVASGGVEHIPFTLQVNLQRAFEIAKDSGLWILGTSEHAKQSWAKVERDRPWLLVLGNEEKGMRRLTEESCDVVCQVPPANPGHVTSLNVSVAAGVLISRLSH